MKQYTLDDLTAAIKSSRTFAEASRILGVRNQELVRSQCVRFGVDYSHFIFSGSHKERPLNEILTPRSNYRGSTYTLKRKLLKAGVLPERCAICRLPPIWNDQPLSLHLDHINGDPWNNTLSNLRLLCPNCHSQTPTYCGRNKRGRKSSPPLPEEDGVLIDEIGKKISGPVYTVRHPRQPRFCCDCGKKVTGTRCKSCAGKFNQPTKITWPSVEDIETKLGTQSFESLARELGVSSNAIRKRIRLHKR